jgi:hypothetical protein
MAMYLLAAPLFVVGTPLPSGSALSPRWCAAPIRTGGTDVVTLAGHLSRQFFWGPPNFGENPKTDSKVLIWTLSLTYPVPVEVNHEFSAGHKIEQIDKIQLNVTGRYLGALNSHLGYRTVITGSLWSAAAPNDMVKVTMNIIDVAPLNAPAPVCDGRRPKQSI